MVSYPSTCWCDCYLRVASALSLIVPGLSPVVLVVTIRIRWGNVTGIGGQFETNSLKVPKALEFSAMKKLPRSWSVALILLGLTMMTSVSSFGNSAITLQFSLDRDIDFPRTYPRKYYDYAVRWTVNSVHWHKVRQEKGRVSLSDLKLMAKVGAARLGMFWHKN